MGLGGLLSEASARRLPSAAARSGAAPTGSGAAPFFDALAEARHEAEDHIGSPDLEGFVSLEEAARRMEIGTEEVLALARSGYLMGRRAQGRLLVRPGIL